jgi:hypothetical protein
MRFVRIILPWIAAGSATVVLISFAYVLSVLDEAPKTIDTPVIDKEKALHISPRDPIVDRVMIALSLVPSLESESPLVASIIENHEDARPFQQGLKEAIVVFEMIVEGDITRFLAVYRGDSLPEKIGPVRSLRPHFISVIRGYLPLLLHAGGSVLAYQELERNPDLVHHDGIRFDGETYERDPTGVAPHNLFMRKASILSLLQDHHVRSVPLPLYETGKTQEGLGATAHHITMNFGSETHNVSYTYKPFYGFYVRSTFAAPEQADPKNVIMLEAFVDGFHKTGFIPWTQTFGEGKMLLFTKGKMQPGTWKRGKGEPFRFFDEKGGILPISKGQSWITLLPTLNMVRWE